MHTDSESNPSQPQDLTIVPKRDLEALVLFGRQCQSTLSMCNQAHQLNQSYIREADKQIQDLVKSLDEEKNKWKPNLLYIIPLTLLTGFGIGILVSR